MRKNKETGQATVEFAIILPILLVLIFGIIDFGWVQSNKIALDNAVRDAVRYESIHINDSSSNSDQDDTSAVLVKSIGDSGYKPYLTELKQTSTDVTVSASMDAKFITGFTGIFMGGKNDVKLTSSATMMIEP